MINYGGRTELFRALVGSHNYNLNIETSDKDYKVFIAPTFDDLYFNKQFSNSSIGETEDFDVHDIRKIVSLFWKSNVNFVEVLFSKEIVLNPCLSDKTKELIREFFNHKNEIVKMNLPYLFNACIGMHISKLKKVDKGTSSTQYLVDKFGYDTKQAMHSLRILDFLRRFADSNFTDFKTAINYKNNDEFRKILLDIKAGKYSKEEYLNLAKNLLKEIDDKYKDIYYSRTSNEELNKELIDIVKIIVKNELKSDFIS